MTNAYSRERVAYIKNADSDKVPLKRDMELTLRLHPGFLERLFGQRPVTLIYRQQDEVWYRLSGRKVGYRDSLGTDYLTTLCRGAEFRGEIQAASDA